MVIGITATHAPSPVDTFEFDAVGFARALAGERQRHGWSTRELASRAKLSQTYIVTLEGAVRAGARRAVPTVDVMTRLAGAFGRHPIELFASSLRRQGLHVVLVLEDHDDSTLERVRRLTRDQELDWVCAISGSQRAEPLPHRTIDLHRQRGAVYEHTQIAESLGRELQTIQSMIEGRDVGFLFGEISEVMSHLDHPEVILAFERQWAAVVGSAADAVGAHARWNVCVYDLDALRRLDDPIRSIVELIEGPDAIWTARGRVLATGVPAAQRVLRRLRSGAGG